MSESIWSRYAGMLDVSISGIERVDELMKRGRTEDARDHLISSARACFQYRWPTKREYTLRRLGESLDAERFPALEPIIAELRRESSEGAAKFIAYLRTRATLDVSSFIRGAEAPPPDFKPAGQRSLPLWQHFAATRDAAIKTELDRRIAEYLDPHVVITWHETASCYPMLVMSAIRHGGIDDATLCKLILFGLDHAEQCNDHVHLSNPAQTSVGGNHLFAWIQAWLQFAILFPEFTRTPALLAAVLARIDDEVSKQVMPDGSMIEGCPGYQNCCIWGASELLRLCKLAGLSLPDRVLRAWERMLRFNIGLLRPDFCVPFLGDSHDDHMPGYAQHMKRYYALPELAWTLSEGKEGSPPAFKSVAFRSIGYFVLRSGWTRDDLYLCFDGGRFGQAHHHEDKLHFELWAHGRMFLVDPGDYGYNDHWMRQWCVLAQAHNTVLVDDAGQCRWREDRDKWYSHVPLENPFTISDTWDTVEASFDGPWERNIGNVRVRRRIAFHKGTPAFYWVTDWAEDAGAAASVGGAADESRSDADKRDREVTQIFHFAHDIATVEEIAGGVRTRIAGGPNLAMLIAKHEAGDASVNGPVTIKRYRGEQNPTRGWCAPKLYTTEPAWEVHVTGRSPLPCRRDFVLLPTRGELPEKLDVVITPTKHGATLTLHIGGESHRVEAPVQ